jgi:hypothetical protein
VYKRDPNKSIVNIMFYEHSRRGLQNLYSSVRIRSAPPVFRTLEKHLFCFPKLGRFLPDSNTHRGVTQQAAERCQQPK